MNSNAKVILGSLGAAVLIASAVVVKLVLFPSVKDAWFSPNPRLLRLVPQNKVIVRPTHFAAPSKTLPTGAAQTQVNGATWMVGRNVPLKMLIASAYQENPGLIALPPNAPATHYDYLVTVPNDPRGRLQEAIRKKLGYTAAKETQNTDVLALKVEDPNSTGLKVSPDSEAAGMAQRNGRLYLTHQPLTTVTGGMESLLKQPVVDETGLTNFYDFSLVFNGQVQRMLQTGSMDSETGKKILAEWGLGLEPDTASVEMLVVKKTH